MLLCPTERSPADGSQAISCVGSILTRVLRTGGLVKTDVRFVTKRGQNETKSSKDSSWCMVPAAALVGSSSAKSLRPAPSSAFIGTVERIRSRPRLENVMRKEVTQTSWVDSVKRVLDLWPYLFITISVAGLAYMALNSAR